MVGKKRILLVDDDEYMIEGLKAFLERRGFDILVANDGHQGKQMIASDKPDLVILDILMPRLGGFPVLEFFRGKTNAPPIIVVTGNEGLRPKRYAEHLGAADFIRKPFKTGRLLEAVNKALGCEYSIPALTEAN